MEENGIFLKETLTLILKPAIVQNTCCCSLGLHVLLYITSTEADVVFQIMSAQHPFILGTLKVLIE